MIASSSPDHIQTKKIEDELPQKEQDSIQEEVLVEESNKTVNLGVEQAENQVFTASLCASLVDSNEGTDLKCNPAEVFHGQRVAKIDKEDVEPEIEY